MASGVTLIDRERRRAASSEEAEGRAYGCARCGRGTIPGRNQGFRVGDKLLNTGLKTTPCSLLLEPKVADAARLPVIRDAKMRETHRRECNGTMFVHEDIRVCAIVKKHSKN